MKTALKLLAALMVTAGFGPAQAVVTPQVNAVFRVVAADGNQVIGSAVITPGGAAAATINKVDQSQALVRAGGRCAFNLRYDEVATTAMKGTTNRLYSNDTLVAQNWDIDLAPGVLRSIRTQAYLFAGTNNIKVVLNATGAAPTVGWVRVIVDGTCGATTAATPTPAASAPATPAPAAPVVVPAVVPGSTLWNALYTAWGYSNYAVTQLRGKGYAGYDDVVRLNADLTTVVTAKRVEQSAYDALMARWTTLNNNAAFKDAMTKITPPTGKV